MQLIASTDQTGLGRTVGIDLALQRYDTADAAALPGAVWLVCAVRR